MNQLLNSQDFIEGLALLLVTALLTGILVPLVKLFFDYSNFRKQKLFEDQLARQNNVIESQIIFLETISTLLWEFHTMIAKVSYYQTRELGSENDNSALAKSAIKEYEEHFWELVIQKIQVEISKSRRLISPPVYQRLKTIYTDVISGVDKELVSLIEKGASKEEWTKFHDERLKQVFVNEIDDTLLMLAEDMNLVKEQKRGTS